MDFPYWLSIFRVIFIIINIYFKKVSGTRYWIIVFGLPVTRLTPEIDKKIVPDNRKNATQVTTVLMTSMTKLSNKTWNI